MAIYCSRRFEYDYNTNNLEQLDLILEEYKNDGWKLYEVLYNENSEKSLSASEFYYLKLNSLIKTGSYLLIFKN